jgi:hypothetical protein
MPRWQVLLVVLIVMLFIFWLFFQVCEPTPVVRLNEDDVMPFLAALSAARANTSAASRCRRLSRTLSERDDRRGASHDRSEWRDERDEGYRSEGRVDASREHQSVNDPPTNNDVAGAGVILDQPIVTIPVVETPQRTHYASNGEWHCARALHQLFPQYPFRKVRPTWLKNPETGHNLELDFYNDDLKLAIEYNGVQHYTFPNRFMRTKEEFIKQLRHDQIKKEVCQVRGVYLICVPYSIDGPDMPIYIYARLPLELRR